MNKNTKIRAKTIISSAGIHNTFLDMLPKESFKLLFEILECFVTFALGGGQEKLLLSALF